LGADDLVVFQLDVPDLGTGSVPMGDPRWEPIVLRSSVPTRVARLRVCHPRLSATMTKKHKHKRKTTKQRVKKVVLAHGEVASVVVPTGYTPFVMPEKQHVEIAPIKKKKRWWDTLFHGMDE
jgi:hypothetical protein